MRGGGGSLRIVTEPHQIAPCILALHYRASAVANLNVYAKHLDQSGFAVGGLLGEDDHEDASTPPEACVKRMSLKKVAESIDPEKAPSDSSDIDVMGEPMAFLIG